MILVQNRLLLLNGNKETMTQTDVKLKKAELLESEGKYLHAAQIYQSLIDNNTIKRLAVVKLAAMYEKMNNIDYASKLLSRYLDEENDDNEIRRLFAHFLISKNQFGKAIDVLASSTRTDDGEVSFLLGIANFNLKQYEIAKINFSDYLETNNFEYKIDALLYNAKCSLNLKKFDEALKFLEILKEIDSNNQEAFFIEAIIFFNKEMYQHSLNAIKQAYRMNSENPDIIKWFGKISFYADDYKNAKIYLKKYINKNEPDADIYTLLGEIYFKMKDFKNSEKYLNLALKMGKDNKLVLNKLKKLTDLKAKTKLNEN